MEIRWGQVESEVMGLCGQGVLWTHVARPTVGKWLNINKLGLFCWAIEIFESPLRIDFHIMRDNIGTIYLWKPIMTTSKRSSLWRHAAAFLLTLALPAFAASVSFSVKIPELDGVGQGGKFVMPAGDTCAMSYYDTTCSLSVGWAGGTDATLVFDPVQRAVIGRGASGTVSVSLPVGNRSLQLLSHARSTSPVIKVVGATKTGLPVSGTLSPVAGSECTPAVGASSCDVVVGWDTQNGGSPVIRDLLTGETLAAGLAGQVAVPVSASSERSIALYGFDTDSEPLVGATLLLTASAPLQVTGSILVQGENPCTPIGGQQSCEVSVSWSSAHAPGAVLKDVETGSVVATGASGAQGISVQASTSRTIALYASDSAIEPVAGTAVSLSATAPLNIAGTLTAAGGVVCSPAPAATSCNILVTWDTSGGGSPQLRDVTTQEVLSTLRNGSLSVTLPATQSKTIALYPSAGSTTPLEDTTLVLRAGPISNDVGVVYGTTGNQCVPGTDAASCTISVTWTASTSAPVLRDEDTGALLSSAKGSSVSVTMPANSVRRLAVYATSAATTPIAYADLTLYAYPAVNGGAFVDGGWGSYNRCAPGAGASCTVLVTSVNGIFKNLTTNTVIGTGSQPDKTITVPAGTQVDLANLKADGTVNFVYSVTAEATGATLQPAGLLQASDTTTGQDTCGINAANSTCTATVYAKSSVANWTVRDRDTNAQLYSKATAGSMFNFPLVLRNGEVRNLGVYTSGGQLIPGTEMTLRTAVKAAGTSLRPDNGTWVCVTPGGQSSCVKNVYGNGGAEARLMYWGGSSWVSVHNKIQIGNAGITIPAGGEVLIAAFPDANVSGQFEPIPGTEVILYATPAP